MRFKKELIAIALSCVILTLGVGPRLNAVHAMECTAEAFQALGLISDESTSVPHPVTNLSATFGNTYYPKYTEYCDVKGTIWPGIALEIILPTTWNQKLYMAGNSGGQTQIYTQNLVQAAAEGYAATTSLGTGYANQEYDQWLIDWAYRTVHETVVIAKKIVKAYYSIDPRYSYFVGCSMGGRQGLMEAQRYPEDFDGILAGSAVNKQMTVLMESPAYLQPQLPTGSQIPPEKLPMLGKAVYDKCDGIDGLVDGIIDDPRNCNFDPDEDLPKCPGDVDGQTCFTIAQLTAIKKIYEGAYSNGTLIVPGMPKGAENFTGGWDPWIVASTLKDTTSYKLHVNTFKHLMTGTTGTTYDFLTDWNFDSNDPATLAVNGGIVESVNPDLTAFKAHGGKIIMYHGWADISNPFATSLAYYNSVYDLMGGQIKDVLSFYMVPGMGHCQGRYSRLDNGSLVPFITLDVFTPWFQPLVDWAESGISPGSVIVNFRSTTDSISVHSWSRPICRYPAVARYNSSGSIDDAANFTCVSPDDQGPIAANVVVNPDPAPIFSSLTLSALVDDTLTGNSVISKAEYNVDGSSYILMNAQDGVYDNVQEQVITTITPFQTPGIYTVCVRAWDVYNNKTGAEECVFLPVYDPTGGFVSGGGWIISPRGAYGVDPSMTGKATFGFISKYKKGASTPTGETEFQFKVANLNFHSDTYEWLVVAGARAQYKGVGTINGDGEYGFMLTAIDGALPGGGGTDKFRVKIWDRVTDVVVYDNMLGAADSGDPTTVIGGGSIVIHK